MGRTTRALTYRRAAAAGRRLAASACLLLVLLAGTVSASAAAVSAASGRTTVWVIVRGPRLPENTALNSIAATGRLSAWAAGIEGFSSDGRHPGRPLLEHWNGRTWSAVRLPSSWPGGLGLVAASSAGDAWALGQQPSGRREHLLHWNGHHWRDSTFPGMPGAFYGNLGLTAASRGRAWLIATADGASAQILGWHGRGWHRQSYPCPVSTCSLDSISARAWNDAWAVGNYVRAGISQGPLALHWDGRSWQAVTVPYVQSGYLTGVFAASATNVRTAVWNPRSAAHRSVPSAPRPALRTPARAARGLARPAPRDRLRRRSAALLARCAASAARPPPARAR